MEQQWHREEDKIKTAYALRRNMEAIYTAFNRANLLTFQECERRIVTLLEAKKITSLSSSKILDIGCGYGGWLKTFLQWGAKPKNIAGIELIDQYASGARNLLPAAVRIECGNATNLPWPDSSFDIVFQSLVFSSILSPAMRAEVAKEMIRVSRPGGVILWYDLRYNNPRNPNVVGIRKSEIYQLFSGCEMSVRTITLAPPISRRICSYSRLGFEILSTISVLRSHYLAAIEVRKSGGVSN
jgi:SAM-dependent methyltransferase